MDFVTIHDLSRELNTAARVIRYRLINCIADGKLKEGEDFRRDDFKDDQHFVWKINPVSFMRETGIKALFAKGSVNELDTDLVTAVNKVVNERSSTVNDSVNSAPPVVTKPVEPDNTVIKNLPERHDHALAREMIDLLKEQIKVKDEQLHDQGEQLKDVNDLNVKLTGTMLQQNQKIENLLRLTGGKESEAESVNNSVTKNHTSSAAAVNQPSQSVNGVDNQQPTSQVA